MELDQSWTCDQLRQVGFFKSYHTYWQVKTKFNLFRYAVATEEMFSKRNSYRWLEINTLFPAPGMATSALQSSRIVGCAIPLDVLDFIEVLPTSWLFYLILLMSFWLAEKTLPSSKSTCDKANPTGINRKESWKTFVTENCLANWISSLDCSRWNKARGK